MTQTESTRRFEVSHDPISRDRLRALLKTFREFKSRYPYFVGMTLFGSLSKGKHLTEENSDSSDIDIYLFIDYELYSSRPEEFGSGNPSIPSIHAAINGYASLPANRSPYRLGIQSFNHFISLDPDSIYSSFGIVSNFYQIQADREELSEEDEAEVVRLRNNAWFNYCTIRPSSDALKLFLAAPFFYDIGGGLRKYRKAYIEKLLSLSPDEGEKYWQETIAATKLLERSKATPGGREIVIPSNIAHAYPQTLAEAAIYYTTRYNSTLQTRVEVENAVTNYQFPKGGE